MKAIMSCGAKARLTRAAFFTRLAGYGRLSQIIKPQNPCILSSMPTSENRLCFEQKRWIFNQVCLLKQQQGLKAVASDRNMYERNERKGSYEPWGAPKREVSIKNLPEDEMIYHGAYSWIISNMKRSAVISSLLSVFVGPLVVFFTNQDISVTFKGAMASSLMFFNASAIVTLHWLAEPYVHKLTWRPKSRDMEIELLTWVGTRTTRIVRLLDVRPRFNKRPFVTFTANGNCYYVDLRRMPSKELCRKLTFYENGKK